MRPPIAEDLTGLERIVDSTPQLKIGLSRLTTSRKREDVMELEAAGLYAAALSADEAAASLVACPDDPTDMCWHMPLSSTSATAVAARHRPRSGNRADLYALSLLQEHGQGPVHDRRRISVGNYMPQQGARPLQLLVCFLANGHSDQVPPWRQRGDDRRLRGGHTGVP